MTDPRRAPADKSILLLVVPALLLLLAGCTGGGSAGAPRGYIFPAELGVTYDLSQGRPLAPDGLAGRLAGARLIFVGEQHDDPRSHAFQARVVGELLAAGREVIVALEMFSPSADEALAGWSAGRLDEAAFLEQSGWYDSWGFPWSHYRKLFSLFRERGVALHGINITRDQRLAVRKGESPPGLEEELAHPGPALAPHREYLWHALAEVGHDDGMTPESDAFLRYLRIQALWDHVMGVRAARLAAEGGPGRVVVVLIGSGHLSHKLGANLRAARAAPGLRQLTVWDRIAEENELRGGRYPVPVGMADLVRIYPEAPAALPPPTLRGLVLATEAGGVRVTDKRFHAPPHLKAIKEGDLITALNGERLTSAAALRLAYESLPRTATARLTIQRGEEETTLEIPRSRDGGGE